MPFNDAIFILIGATVTGADPGFLERGFIFRNVWGFCFADIISFSLNIT